MTAVSTGTSVVGDINIPSRDSELFKAVGHAGLKSPNAIADLESIEATANLARKAGYDQILHRATNPARFTDQASIVDVYIGEHAPLYAEIGSVPEFTHQPSDHSPLWFQLSAAGRILLSVFRRCTPDGGIPLLYSAPSPFRGDDSSSNLVAENRIRKDAPSALDYENRGGPRRSSGIGSAAAGQHLRADSAVRFTC